MGFLTCFLDFLDSRVCTCKPVLLVNLLPYKLRQKNAVKHALAAVEACVCSVAHELHSRPHNAP